MEHSWRLLQVNLLCADIDGLPIGAAVSLMAVILGRVADVFGTVESFIDPQLVPQESRLRAAVNSKLMLGSCPDKSNMSGPSIYRGGGIRLDLYCRSMLDHCR